MVIPAVRRGAPGWRNRSGIPAAAVPTAAAAAGAAAAAANGRHRNWLHPEGHCSASESAARNPAAGVGPPGLLTSQGPLTTNRKLHGTFSSDQ